MNQILPQVFNCRVGKSYFIHRGHNSISYKGYDATEGKTPILKESYISKKLSAVI